MATAASRGDVSKEEVHGRGDDGWCDDVVGAGEDRERTGGQVAVGGGEDAWSTTL